MKSLIAIGAFLLAASISQAQNTSLQPPTNTDVEGNQVGEVPSYGAIETDGTTMRSNLYGKRTRNGIYNSRVTSNGDIGEYDFATNNLFEEEQDGSPIRMQP